MRTLTLLRKTVSPADPPVTLRVVTHSGAGDLLPFGEERALPIREQGEEVSFFLPDSAARQEMRARGCHTLAVKMVFYFEAMELFDYFDGSQEPGASWHQRYRDSVCGPRALEGAPGRGRLSAPCAESPAPLSAPGPPLFPASTGRHICFGGTRAPGPACSPSGTWRRRGPVPRPCRTSRRPRRSPPWSPRPRGT